MLPSVPAVTSTDSVVDQSPVPPTSEASVVTGTSARMPPVESSARTVRLFSNSAVPVPDTLIASRSSKTAPSAGLVIVMAGVGVSSWAATPPKGIARARINNIAAILRMGLSPD